MGPTCAAFTQGLGAVTSGSQREGWRGWDPRRGGALRATGAAPCPVLHRHPVPGELLRVEHPGGRQVRDLHGRFRVCLPHPALPCGGRPAMEAEDLPVCLPEEAGAGESLRVPVGPPVALRGGTLTPRSAFLGATAQGVHRQRSQRPLGLSEAMGRGSLGPRGSQSPRRPGGRGALMFVTYISSPNKTCRDSTCRTGVPRADGAKTLGFSKGRGVCLLGATVSPDGLPALFVGDLSRPAWG